MKLKEYIDEELHTRNTNFSNIMHLSVHGSGTDYVAQTIGLLMPKHRWISPNYIPYPSI